MSALVARLGSHLGRWFGSLPSGALAGWYRANIFSHRLKNLPLNLCPEFLYVVLFVGTFGAVKNYERCLGLGPLGVAPLFTSMNALSGNSDLPFTYNFTDTCHEDKHFIETIFNPQLPRRPWCLCENFRWPWCVDTAFSCAVSPEFFVKLASPSCRVMTWADASVFFLFSYYYQHYGSVANAPVDFLGFRWIKPWQRCGFVYKQPADFKQAGTCRTVYSVLVDFRNYTG